MFSFQLTNGLCVFKALAQRVDEDRIKPVDALAVTHQDLCGAGRIVKAVLGWVCFISQGPILLV